jgi:GDPmannose 4,6-dehydratase
MRAIITGITGQDGSYLAEFLLSRGYEVHGAVRAASYPRYERIQPILHRVRLHQADLLDQISLIHLIEEVRPDEIYNLAGPSSPSWGWAQPVLCSDIIALGTIRLLEAVRIVDPNIRLFHASSCDMYGRAVESPQTERTAFLPTTPFGAAKLNAHWAAAAYRDKYGMKISCGILFDHESPRRGMAFPTRQITHAAARVKLGLQSTVVLDTLNTRRDRGFAGDFVRAFWMMLQHPAPDDYVIATGRPQCLEDVCRYAFEAVNLDWRDFVRIKTVGAGSSGGPVVQGDASHARRKLLWEPEVAFPDLIQMMVDADVEQYSPKNRPVADILVDEQVRDHQS